MRAVRDAGPTRPARARPGPVTVTTEYLHVIPDKEIASTDKAVTIEEPRGIIESVGLELDNKAKTLKLKSARPRHAATAGAPEVTRTSAIRRSPRRSPSARSRSLAPAAHAEKADREKPITFTSDDGEVNYEKRTGMLKGNVVITQGTLTIKANRIDFKQNADNSLSATAFGNPLAFRQKRDDADDYYEGWAQRAEYDGQKEQLELFDNAILKRGTDEIRSNYISYNAATELFKAEGPPASTPPPPATSAAATACAASSSRRATRCPAKAHRQRVRTPRPSRR